MSRYLVDSQFDLCVWLGSFLLESQQNKISQSYMNFKENKAILTFFIRMKVCLIRDLRLLDLAVNMKVSGVRCINKQQILSKGWILNEILLTF